MNFKYLNECLRLLGYPLHDNIQVINELISLSKDTSIYNRTYPSKYGSSLKYYPKNLYETQIQLFLLNPLEAELNEALIIASVKNDVVKYFVSEFYNLIPFYRKHEEILLKNEYIEINPYKYASKTYEGQIIDLNWLQNYAIHSHVLFNEVFQIIQISCLKFDVSFYNVCNEINFPINFINDNTVRFIEEQKREKEEFDNWKRIRSTNLINLFFQQYGNHEEFNKVMENLYKLGYIDSSFYWTDRKSGYKGLAINTIKFICEKKLDRKISNSEIIILLKNSFRVSVKEDLVKRRKAENLIKLDI